MALIKYTAVFSASLLVLACSAKYDVAAAQQALEACEQQLKAGQYEQAFAHCSKANHEAAAQLHLGSMYLQGLGVAQDYKQALYWHQLAAEQGNLEAQHKLAELYDRAIPRDYQKSVYWYRKAAKGGYTPAQFSLGRMYFLGRGVTQDYKTAMAWWSVAAALGDKQAADKLPLAKDKLTPYELRDAKLLVEKYYAKYLD